MYSKPPHPFDTGIFDVNIILLCAKCALRRTLRIVFAMRHLKTLYRFDCLHKKIWLIKNRSFLQFTYIFFQYSMPFVLFFIPTDSVVKQF